MTEYKQLERLNYFSGRLLTEADFQHEQEYHRDRARRNNRFLHGWGIVSGLSVGIEDNSTIVVGPGFAIDCAGNELVLAAPQYLPLPCLVEKHYVTVRYHEIPSDPQPSLDEMIEFSRILETVCIELVRANPADGHHGMLAGSPGCGEAHGLCIASLSQREKCWRVIPAKRSLLPRSRR